MRFSKKSCGCLRRFYLVILFTVPVIFGCAPSVKTSLPSETKTFETNDAATRLTVALETPTFQEIVSPQLDAASPVSDSDLANSIRRVRIDSSELRPSAITLEISFVEQSTAVFDLQMRVDTATYTSGTKLSRDHRFQIAGRCTSSHCDHGSFVITELNSKRSAHIDYTRSTDYAKADGSKPLTANVKDASILNDVIEYHLPIIRHSSRIANRTLSNGITDLLVIARPSDADIAETRTDNGDPMPSTPAQPNSIKQDSVELDIDESYVNAEAVTATSQNTLALTSNAAEAFGVIMPTQRSNGTTNGNPVLLPGVQIVPIAKQNSFEPSSRIAVIAKAFVDQHVKIYHNSCNIFVREVMTLAGYTDGALFNANDFGSLFKVRTQGLEKWERASFNIGSATDNIQSLKLLQSRLDHLPESYAVVAQVIRPGRHGHVGIVAKFNGISYMIDASLDAHGPRQAPVKASQLLNATSRKNLNLFEMKGLEAAPAPNNAL